MSSMNCGMKKAKQQCNQQITRLHSKEISKACYTKGKIGKEEDNNAIMITSPKLNFEIDRVNTVDGPIQVQLI